ncbi:hypothetical protein FN846DRAFT_911349 [Sphaerosporella brunnea]|uniref:Uncharacterized protein n=1 Tax=Sphaerosporella brunnea TaxID=1250544 RepID=A0A5J5EM92_9PEZI|nr:hypothetical protein FN846DRAFT_911349 [Sphaerosporella brunnea]
MSTMLEEYKSNVDSLQPSGAAARIVIDWLFDVVPASTTITNYMCSLLQWTGVGSGADSHTTQAALPHWYSMVGPCVFCTIPLDLDPKKAKFMVSTSPCDMKGIHHCCSVKPVGVQGQKGPIVYTPQAIDEGPGRQERAPVASTGMDQEMKFRFNPVSTHFNPGKIGSRSFQFNPETAEFTPDKFKNLNGWNLRVPQVPAALPKAATGSAGHTPPSADRWIAGNDVYACTPTQESLTASCETKHQWKAVLTEVSNQVKIFDRFRCIYRPGVDEVKKTKNLYDFGTHMVSLGMPSVWSCKIREGPPSPLKRREQDDRWAAKQQSQRDQDVRETRNEGQLQALPGRVKYMLDQKLKAILAANPNDKCFCLHLSESCLECRLRTPTRNLDSEPRLLSKRVPWATPTYLWILPVAEALQDLNPSHNSSLTHYRKRNTCAIGMTLKKLYTK